MKRLVLFLLLTQAWSLTLSKSVSGPELIDVNETLQISIGIVADAPVYIERIEDAIPDHFVAFNYPSSCQQTASKLICNFGQEIQGTTSINYDVLSLGTGYGMFSSPQLFYSGGIKTIDFFRQYFIGRPKIEVSLTGRTTLLPGEDIIATVSLSNPGTKPVEKADLTIYYSNETIKEFFSLSPGEFQTRDYLVGQAQKQGFLDIRADVSWLNNTRTESMSVVFISPSVSVSRTVELEWHAGDGDLKSYVVVTYKFNNDGTATGNVSMLSGDSITVGPSETKTIQKIYSEKAPVEKMSVTDSRGVVYNVYSFEEETPEMNKGFFVLVYEYVASDIPPLILIGILLGALYFSKKFPNPNLKAGFLVIALVSVLMLYSYYSVGALSFPFGGKLSEFDPTTAKDLVLGQLPGNFSG
ncbi:MAG: hypothetical protein GOV01_03385 [Candidatus Altiarchaeota archaeon]|nr:hypothetical protein [Candidatus Altiarchaeota archaeon]